VTSSLRWAAVIALCAALAPQPQPQAPRPSAFAAQIAALSEAPGYFDTDNLLSNERSYLQIVPELQRRHVRGGAYIGVGPDQNFSYIAAVRPALAIIVDVRRDNMLLHLLFKALFSLSRTRIEYLALLTGRPVPGSLETWRTAPVERLIAYVDNTAAAPARLDAAIARIGVPLSADDRATISRFHGRFVDEGLSLRFQSAGRPPQAYYPAFRDLLRETDASGRQANYLASEEAFQFVKGLQARDLVIPVTGDLSGPSALTAIGRLIAARGERLSAFYVSNVEFYLFGAGTFPRFAGNLERLPRSANSVLIRSVFGRLSAPARSGDASSQHVQPVAELLRDHAAGRIRSYADIAAR
jgi:hypothetical protein